VSTGSGQLDAWSAVVSGDTPVTYVHWTFTGGGSGWETDSSRDDAPPAGEI
jgi:hypothetical protein